MNQLLDQVTTQAMHLPPSERAELVERLLNTLEAPIDAEMEAAWAEEAEARIQAHDAGETKSIDGDEVFRRIQGRQRP